MSIDVTINVDPKLVKYVTVEYTTQPAVDQETFNKILRVEEMIADLEAEMKV